MNSTADSWNRIRDKENVESNLKLPEEGNDSIEFYSPKGSLLAVGYTRVVYGDHGPYIEFESRHIVRANWKVSRLKGPQAWYDECIPKDGSKVLLYVQKKDVSMLPNPPRGKFSVNNNRREGYADYKVGMLYISPWELSIKI